MPSQINFSAPDAHLELRFEMPQLPAPGARSPIKSRKTPKIIPTDPPGPPSTSHSFPELSARRVCTVMGSYVIGPVEQAQVAVAGRGSRRGRPLAAGVPSRDSAHLGGRSRLAPPVVAVCVQ